MNVHQFHSGASEGDAITNGMVLMQRHLRALGYGSEIFVEHLPAALGLVLRPMAELHTLTPDDLLIVHHSMGHDRLEEILRLPSRKALLYHNITPSAFFPPEAIYHRYAAVGRQQLQILRGHVSAAAADSEFSARELRRLGYPDVRVLPVLVDVDRLRTTAPRLEPQPPVGRPFTILFVGRVCDNKGHLQLIRAMRAMAGFWDSPFRLVCVGQFSETDPYYRQVRTLVQEAGLESRVLFTGSVTDSALCGWYRAADAYLSLSQHEGFGVPLIEAMLFDVPVLALATTAVPYTMDGVGMLLRSADPFEVAKSLVRLARDSSLRRTLTLGQRQRLAEFEPARTRERVGAWIREAMQSGERSQTRGADPFHIAVEGPFETTYSLAVINRELALALDESHPGQVSLHATEGPGDYTPAPRDLERCGDRVRMLWERSRSHPPVDASIRNMHPPRVRDSRAQIRAMNFFWEETAIPASYVQDFNLSVDAFMLPSRFVGMALRGSGVTAPQSWVGGGADHILRYPPRPHGIRLPDGFHFLHVSSGFPRKGVDVLLEAFGRAFSGAEGVSLVIKAFPNPHNRIKEQIAEAQRRFPRLGPVVLAEGDLTYGQLRQLYSDCQALVAPSRGEGFGLPMAEAMLLDVPVITTAFGGQRDFCTPETAWLIDYDLRPSKSHLTDGEALWAEPSVEHLTSLLREVHRASPKARRARTAAAKDLVCRQYTWAATASRARQVIDTVRYTDAPSDQRLRIGWVSTWKEKCGIASYSESLVGNLPADGLDVALFTRHGTSGFSGSWKSTPCWRDRNDRTLAELKQAVLSARVDALVIQFNFWFFDVKALAELARELEALGIPVIITFHATADVQRGDLHVSLREGVAGLEHISGLLVHSRTDFKRLYNFGFTRNVTLFPHGAPFRPETSIAAARRRLGLPEGRPIIASYGFMLPPKGLSELVQAFVTVRERHRDAMLFLVNALYPAPESPLLAQTLREQIQRAGLEPWIRIFDDYLPAEQSLALLECASLLVFPYQHSAESSSAAVRFGLSVNRPVLCTPLDVFDDVRPAVAVSEDTSTAALARTISAMVDEDSSVYRRRIDSQRDWLAKHSWDTVGKRMHMLIKAAVRQAHFDGRRVH